MRFEKRKKIDDPTSDDAHVMGYFSVKVDLTQFRKYHSLCNRQVNHIGVEHQLFLQVISLEFPPFAKLTQVKLSCQNSIGCESYMTNVLH